MGRPQLTDEYRAILTARFAETRTAELAREMGVSYRTLCRWAAEMGLEKSKKFRQGMSAIATIGRKETLFRKGHRGTCPSLDDEKKAYLQQHFATIPNMALARALGVNDRTVRRWASQLGLRKDREVIEMHRRSRMSPTPEQWFQIVCTIRELYPGGRDEEAARLTGYSVAYVRKVANRYGFERNDAYRQRMKDKRRFRRYPPWLLADMAAYFPTHTDKECAARFGIRKTQMQDIARRHGWKKDAGHMRRVHDSNIAAALRRRWA